MGMARAPENVKLICGMLSSDSDLLRRAAQLLARRFGGIDLRSEVWPFHETDFYEDEMGANLLRQFISFSRLINPGQLAEIKHEANALEQEFAAHSPLDAVSRPVNLDPGYVGGGKLVLATTKDRAHRIYIGNQLYAEVTLQYARDEWRIQPWTYPDYRRAEYHQFFNQVRKRLLDERDRD